MLDNLGLMNAGDVLQYWPVILIAIGLAKLGSAITPSGRLSAGIWIVAGALLLFDTFNLLRFDVWDLWPLALVVLGIHIMMRASRRHHPSMADRDPGDVLNAFAVMAGVERKYSTQAFGGGEATAVMGSCEIDLRNASIDGTEVVVDVFAFWGSVELRVPADWAIQNDAIAIMGAVEDSRKEISVDPNKRLVIKGFAVMAGIEIKN